MTSVLTSIENLGSDLYNSWDEAALAMNEYLTSLYNKAQAVPIFDTTGRVTISPDGTFDLDYQHLVDGAASNTDLVYTPGALVIPIVVDTLIASITVDYINGTYAVMWRFLLTGGLTGLHLQKAGVTVQTFTGTPPMQGFFLDTNPGTGSIVYDLYVTGDGAVPSSISERKIMSMEFRR